ILIEWTTQSEHENLGFVIYRSPTATGEFEPITPDLIMGAGTSQSRHQYQYEDFAVLEDNTYYYKLADVDFRGRLTFHGPIKVTLKKTEIFSLSANFPNPFNSNTNLVFSLAKRGKVRFFIQNLKGQTVRALLDRTLSAGSYEVIWDGRDDRGMALPSGFYLYTIICDQWRETRSLQLIR
ncbi:hypothetical protein JXO59_12635, partial [candidate division KSB1 bacterium]|nr:hypothetical protein [candidate division KSB1 bacterium]